MERTTCLDLSLAAILLTAVSGVPGLAFGRRSARGPGHREPAADRRRAARRADGAASPWRSGAIETSTLAGALPELSLHLRLDPLAAFFLVPVYVLGAAGTLYGARYWRQAEHPENGRKLRLCFGILIASLAGVVLAADGVAFLFAWEIMALSAFLLVTTEDERAEVQQAGWVYLVATHAGTLALFALFGSAVGGHRLARVPAACRPARAGRASRASSSCSRSWASA